MIRKKAYGKINLALDILGKREDGYHEVKMLMQKIPLYDDIYIDMMSASDVLAMSDEDALQNTLPLYKYEVKLRPMGYLKLTSGSHDIPLDENNLVYKAVESIFKEINFSFPPLITVHIDKKIPVAAGLGGGSSDAAYTLMGLNEFFELDLSEEVLMEKALAIGADVPFFIKGSAALAEGIGEKLTKIDGLRGVSIVLSKPDISVSTAAAYGLYAEKHGEFNIVRPDIDALITDISDGNYDCIGKNMINVFEPVIEATFLEVRATKDLLSSFSPIVTLMSGSGPSVFSIFSDKEKALTAYEALKEINKQTFIFEMEDL